MKIVIKGEFELISRIKAGFIIYTQRNLGGNAIDDKHEIANLSAPHYFCLGSMLMLIK